MSRALNLIGIAVGLFAIVVQFGIAVDRFTDEGMSLGGAIVKFFSFFTVLTNIFAVAVHAAALSGSKLGFFRRPTVMLTATVAITIVGIVYHVLLAALWDPQGMQKITDILLHYVAPALLVVWWIAYGRSGTARLADIRYVLIYPLAYLGYVLVRAPIAGEVPYPFLDYWQYGWPHVVQMVVIILALFLAVAALAVVADRFLPSRSRQNLSP